MGSAVSNSIPGSSGTNVELNVPNENSNSNKRPPLPRQKRGDGKLLGSAKTPGSVDQSSNSLIFGNSEASERSRMDFETLKFTKDQEIEALQRKEQKLEIEKGKLRAELQAVSKQCQKLRAERDTALNSGQEATSRAIALEQDREKIQRQFKIFRETKESEIQALLQAKRQLESQFQSMQAYGVATGDDMNYSINDVSQKSIKTSGQMYSNDEWWGVADSETTSIFGSYTQLRNDMNMDYAESMLDLQDNYKHSDERNANSPNPLQGTENVSTILPIINNPVELYGKNILKCYIACTLDTKEDMDSFLLHDLFKDIQHLCEKEGKFLSMMKFTDLQDYFDVTLNSNHDKNKSYSKSVIKFAISHSDICIFFIGETLGKYTALECEKLASANDKDKINLIVGIKSREKDGSNQVIHEELNSDILNSPTKLMTYEQPTEVCEFAARELSKAVTVNFGIKKHSDNDFDLSCNDEIKLDEQMEQEQHELSTSTNQPHSLPLVGLERCYERLDEVVTSPGPVPPFLVSGTSGSGKTSILSSWTSRLQKSQPGLVVLQHFVTNSKALDAEPVILLRHLLLQLRQHIPIYFQPTNSSSMYDLIKLRETLPRYLEQYSTRGNKRILIVVDSIDLLKDAQHHFNWLLDPLHVGIRVVISVGANLCPEEWRQFPTIHLEPLSIPSAKIVLKSHAEIREVKIPQQMEHEVFAHCRTATTCHPLYIKLLSVLLCNICQNILPENSLTTILQTRDSTELYRLIFHFAENNCRNSETLHSMKHILQMLACSRSGLSENELLLFFPNLTWPTLTDILMNLKIFCIVQERAGLFVPHNSEVENVMYDIYVGNDVHRKRCYQKMLVQLKNQQWTPRITDIKLWLLRREEEREILAEVLKLPQVFYILYSRGRASQLVDLWNYLNEEKQKIAGYYSSEIRKLENAVCSGNHATTMGEVSLIYLDFGRFMKDLALFEKGVEMLQRCIEIQETTLNPDHPLVADAFHHLASVYFQWGKLTTAEPLYRQALELVECCTYPDNMRIVQELNSLVRICHKSGKNEESEGFQQRLLSITGSGRSIGIKQSEKLRKYALRMHGFTVDNDTMECAKALNDLGVLYYLQNHLELAESYFHKSVELREKLMGKMIIELAQNYHNLSCVYNAMKNFNKAVESMNKCLNLRKTLDSSNVVAIVSCLRYLIIFYKKGNDLKNVCDIHSQLVDIMIASTGENSIETANAMVNLAVTECQLEQLDAALPIYERALEIYRNTLGNNSKQVSQTLSNIALLLYNKGSLKEAAFIYNQVCAQREQGT